MKDELQHSRLRRQVKQALKANGLPQRQAAREMGMDESRFNLWLNNKYPGDNQEIATKAERWLELREKKTAATAMLPEDPEWVETPTAKNIIQVLSYAHIAQKIAVVYGEAGAGKTRSCRHYAAINNNVWHITITSASGTLAACLERIARGLGLHDYSGRASRLEAELAEYLSNRKGLLILDEAQHMNLKALESVRALHDATGMGLVLVGNEKVYSQLTGGTRQSAFSQLFSRVGKRLRLVEVKKGDVEMLAAAWGVKDRAIISRLKKVANEPGTLRGVAHVLQLAWLLASGSGDDLTIEHIEASIRDLCAI